MPTWPTWWDWELELSSHLFKRMADRNFSEIDVRRMFVVASAVRRDIVPDRWIIETRHRRKPWEILVEPDSDVRRVDPGLIIDLAATGEALGIEITAPAPLSVTTLNRVLRELGCAPVRRADLAPLRAA